MDPDPDPDPGPAHLMRPPRPSRRPLPHDVPPWIDPARETYFITLNCEVRGVNTLCHKEPAARLFESVGFRHRSRAWHCHLCLLMPDHLHALITFTGTRKSMPKTIGDWKRWLALKEGIPWQADFFEHRIRSEHEEVSKAQYILQNPVRKGLVKQAEDWPYVWRPNRMEDVM